MNAKTDTSDKSNRGPWIHTWGGGRFYYLDPNPEEVFIEDIAHALSLQCRFNGHTTLHYSVAEHSILVSDMVYSKTNDVEVAMAALLHDAAETYIGDVVSPLKTLLTEFKQVEARVEKCVAAKFGLDYPWDEEIHLADKAVLAMEFRSVAPFADEDMARAPLSSTNSERRFLEKYAHLSALRDGSRDKG